MAGIEGREQKRGPVSKKMKSRYQHSRLSPDFHIHGNPPHTHTNIFRTMLAHCWESIKKYFNIFIIKIFEIHMVNKANSHIILRF